MKRSRPSAFTRTELLVALLILVILGATLAALVLPAFTSAVNPSRMHQVLSNMKQLQMATQMMALDSTTTGDTNLGWPGDTGASFSDWTHLLVASNYLSAPDLADYLSVPGKIVKPRHLPVTMTNTALLVYAVKDESEGNTVFLSSANFTNSPTGGSPLDTNAVFFGHRGFFIVFHKSGEGALLLPNQVGNTNAIGSFAPLLR